MTKVMSGVRVLEVAEYAMAPAAAAIMSDWGANVLKIEHAERGDPIRGLRAWGVAPDVGGFTYLWEPFNRGKRSMGLNIATPEGRNILLRLAKNADVFITNFLPDARRNLGIDVADLRAVNPKIIYARGSAHGPKGPESERGGFDGLTYWQRSGAGVSAMPADTTDLITLPAPAFGDSQTGTALAAGVSAALFHRERTGEALVVDVSLLAAGMWAMQASMVGANLSGMPELPHSNHSTAPSPTSNYYRCSDGRFIALSMLQSDRYWARLCTLMGRADLANDPRFCTIDKRAENNRACILELDSVFEQHPLPYWTEILAQQEGQWAIVQVAKDLNEDRQAWANGYIQTVDYEDGRSLNLVSTPIQFDESPPELRPAPEHGAHTEEVLLEELGYDWDAILELKQQGVIS
ncbi:CaiB/BaiF CoA transferase family protein [Phenylobacterium sp. VNQ135]|uniref:CaiB/BaiF CoA transferase family protein n=1 Tax=Phenylobacterium sp. VNQ135 TaxID=3400922 RepID=UPI003C075340